MSRLTEMEAFAAVVEEGGFTEAARKLGVSKSSVSKHISALEDRLGARLLSRTTRRVNPTEIGMAYYDRASRILNDAGEADALVAKLHGTPSGSLQVSAAVDFGIHVLAPLTGGFLDDFPEISVNLDLNDRPVDLVGDNFDIGIRVGEMKDCSLRARKLSEFRWFLVASPKYLELHGRPATIADLSKHKMLTTSNRAGGSQWKLPLPTGELQTTDTHAIMSINDGRSLLNAAIEGLGIARLPDFICQKALKRGLVEHAMPAMPPDTSPVFAVYPPGRFTQPKVRAYIDYLIARLHTGASPATERFAPTGS